MNIISNKRSFPLLIIFILISFATPATHLPPEATSPTRSELANIILACYIKGDDAQLCHLAKFVMDTQGTCLNALILHLKDSNFERDELHLELESRAYTLWETQQPRVFSLNQRAQNIEPNRPLDRIINVLEDWIVGVLMRVFPPNPAF